MNKYIKIFLRIVVSAGLIYFIFTKVNFWSVIQQIKKVDPLYFSLAIACIFICWLINSKKWQIILFYLGFEQKVLTLFNLNLISNFYAAILPGGQLTGEVIKCYKITKDNSSKGKLIFSVLMDRLTGFFAMIFLGLFGILISKTSIGNYRNILIMFFILAVGSLALLVFFNQRLARLGEKLYFKLFGNRQLGLLARIHGLLFVFRGAYKLFFISIAYSFLFQFFSSLSVYFIALALNLQLAFVDVLWIVGLVSIIVFIPITISGLGLREGSLIYLLGLIGVSSVLALSLSLLASLIYFLTGLVGGVIEFYEVFIKRRHFK